MLKDVFLSSSSFLPLLVVLLVAVLNVVDVPRVYGLENTFTIHNMSEFVRFSDDVNSGTNYLGTTVFLDSDIEFTQEFSNEFRLIGVNETVDFIGTFDGKVM